MSEEVLDDSKAIETPEQDVQETPTEDVITEDASLEEKIEALAKEDVPSTAEPAAEPAKVEDAVPAPVVDGATGVAPEAKAAGDVTAGEEKYEPNAKYSVLNEEYEFDKELAPLLQSKEAEDKLRELYEKAHGLDHIKADREQIREDFGTYKADSEKRDVAINTLTSYLDSGDLESFFTSLKIPQADVMRYALQAAQREEWTPEQRAVYDQQIEHKRRANVYEESYNSNQDELESLRQDQVVKDYQLEMYKPDVQVFEAAFNQRKGPDAFRNEVAELGTYNEKVHGKVLPISELVGSIMKKFEPWIGATTPAVAATPAAITPQATPQAVSQPAELPVIPNTGPAGQAPAAKAITSIADLEKIADAL